MYIILHLYFCIMFLSTLLCRGYSSFIFYCLYSVLLHDYTSIYLFTLQFMYIGQFQFLANMNIMLNCISLITNRVGYFSYACYLFGFPFVMCIFKTVFHFLFIFFLWDFQSFLLTYRHSLCSLSSLSVLCAPNIFSHSVTYLFIS